MSGSPPKTHHAAIITLLEDKYSPDVVCHALGICTGTCHIFPAPHEGIVASSMNAQTVLRKKSIVVPVGSLPAICKIPGIKEICDIINRWCPSPRG